MYLVYQFIGNVKHLMFNKPRSLPADVKEGERCLVEKNKEEETCIVPFLYKDSLFIVASIANVVVRTRRKLKFSHMHLL